MFDEIILNYTLISPVDLTTSAPVDTTIAQYVIGGSILQVPGGFSNGISCSAAIDSPTDVPAPATLLLFGLGLAGLGHSRHNKSLG